MLFVLTFYLTRSPIYHSWASESIRPFPPPNLVRYLYYFNKKTYYYYYCYYHHHHLYIHHDYRETEGKKIPLIEFPPFLVLALITWLIFRAVMISLHPSLIIAHPLYISLSIYLSLFFSVCLFALPRTWYLQKRIMDRWPAYRKWSVIPEPANTKVSYHGNSTKPRPLSVIGRGLL